MLDGGEIKLLCENGFLGSIRGGKMTVLEQHEKKKKSRTSHLVYTFTACQQGDRSPDRKYIRNQDIIHILVIRPQAVVIHISQ